MSFTSHVELPLGERDYLVYTHTSSTAENRGDTIYGRIYRVDLHSQLRTQLHCTDWEQEE